ncbi:MAG: hypothetical protein V4662_26305 [Verrucomicrobiota bacterium]
MKNDDPTDLESRLSSLPLSPLPPEWKAELLARLPQAAPAAVPISIAPRLRRTPPRWLAIGWGLAWAAVIVLHLSTPATQGSKPFTGPATARSLKQRTDLLQSLLVLK